MPRPHGYDGVVEACDLAFGVCEWRMKAMRQPDPEFFFDFQLGGWVLTEAPLRHSSFRALYYHETEAGLHDGEPFLWTCCPNCGGELPKLRPATICDEDGG